MSTRIYSFIILISFIFNLFAQSPSTPINELINIAEYGIGEDQSNAQVNLGLRYYYGTYGVERNPEKAVFWYRKAANNNNKYAMYNLANCYLTGFGLTKDTYMAIHWMTKSANNYLPAASLELGKWYYWGTNVTKDYSKASKYLKDAAFGNEKEAMYLLGWCFANGEGADKDSTKAIFWANRAIEENYYNGYDLLGYMYIYGASVARNIQVGKSYLEDGIKLKSGVCMNRLASTYEDGYIGEKDINKAIDLYKQAYNHQYYQAAKSLYRIFYNTKDFENAIYWCKELYDNGYSDYKYQLLILYELTNNYKESFDFCYKLSVMDDDVEAMNQLAYYYANGQGTIKDVNQALKIIDKAISLSPNNADFLDSKGEFLIKMGNIKAAKKIWKEINKRFPNYYKIYKIENQTGTTFSTYMESL